MGKSTRQAATNDQVCYSAGMSERLEDNAAANSVSDAIRELERYEQNAKVYMAQQAIQSTGNIIHYPPDVAGEVAVEPKAPVVPIEQPVPIVPSSEGDDDWQARAACRPLGKAEVYDERDIFFGGRDDEYSGTGQRVRLEKEAKKLCGECAVTIACLQYALERDERFGIWGGLDEAERRRLQRKRV